VQGRAVPDRAVPDRAVPDRAVPDRAVPDRAVPDRAVPDPAVPDRRGGAWPLRTWALPIRPVETWPAGGRRPRYTDPLER
jgi:hypothetical protein